MYQKTDNETKPGRVYCRGFVMLAKVEDGCTYGLVWHNDGTVSFYGPRGAFKVRHYQESVQCWLKSESDPDLNGLIC